MFQTIKNAWRIADTRRKLIFTAFIVILYRIGCVIPVPYVNSSVWASTFENAQDTIFGYLNILSGSSFSQGTLFALSITPYITSSIVMQLLTIAIPPLERMAKEPDGQKKITQITRYVTVVLAVITALGYYLTMKRSSGTLSDTSFFAGLVIVTSYVAGASIIMWLGEKINDGGIGNGISIILFFNIVSRFGSLMSTGIQVIQGTSLGWLYVLIAAVIMLAVITFIVWMDGAERRLPVQYAKRTVGRKMYGGMNTHLPIKLNMSGVMPIIFAQSIVSLPSTLALIFGWENSSFVNFFSMTGAFGIALNFVLIIAFAYFYLAISFNPIEVANNLKKNGGTILGYRPGAPTANYIRKVLNRVTLIGALFLGIIAIFPQLLSLLWPESNLGYLVFGGSSIIILVGVVNEVIKELESEITMRHYKGFLE